MLKWSQKFLALQPSAAKVFAIAWQKRIEALLEERGIQAVTSEVLQTAFKTEVEKSSSLPVRDKLRRALTLYCAILLLANYHPYGEVLDTRMRPMGWSDAVWDMYLKMLRRHGLVMSIQF